MITLALRLGYKSSIGTSDTNSEQYNTASHDNLSGQVSQKTMDSSEDSQDLNQKRAIVFGKTRKLRQK